MNPNPRNLRQMKAEWKARYGNDRRNGGRTGRVKEARPRGSRRGR